MTLRSLSLTQNNNFEIGFHYRVHSGLTNLDAKKQNLTMILSKTTLEAVLTRQAITCHKISQQETNIFRTLKILSLVALFSLRLIYLQK